MTGITPADDEKHLLTGATGFLGSHLMAGLLLKGKGVVIAGRPLGRESLRDRIRKLLSWFGIEHLGGLLEFYETDFLKSRMGLAGDAYENLCRRGLPIIHCASDTSFAEKNRSRVMKSNVEALAEILNFASESRTRCFHFISTAYAAGTDCVECPEAPVQSTHFANIYEESKAHAENMVFGRCREGGVPFTILRPSIVYGDSVTGRSLKFNAVYYPVRSLQHIRDIYIDDIKNNNGKKSAEYGIHMNEEGALHIPLRIFIPTDGSINLIPVDYFTQTTLSILEKPATGTFYHITGNHPESMERLAAYAERFLHMTGIEVVIGASGTEEMRNPPEELLDYCIKAYRPYMSDRRIFPRRNTDGVTCGALPPDFSYEIFRKCMAFAVSAGWGKTLFS